MTDNISYPPSTLLQYLPAIYQRDPFIGQFLLAFEQILLGRKDANVPFPDVGVDFPHHGLEETIGNLATYFDPMKTPEDFLPWLADWTAFTLRADLPPEKQRQFIANIIQFYRWRGTKENLRNLLAIFTVGVPTIIESSGAEFQVGVHSTIGVDAYLSGGPPHYFQVTIALNRVSATVLNRQLQIARALIDLEKPAHTFYDLEPVFPTMQINVHSTVGVDTLLGTQQEA
jgi:phage tail-like protein